MPLQARQSGIDKLLQSDCPTAAPDVMNTVIAGMRDDTDSFGFLTARTTSTASGDGWNVVGCATTAPSNALSIRIRPAATNAFAICGRHCRPSPSESERASSRGPVILKSLDHTLRALKSGSTKFGEQPLISHCVDRTVCEHGTDTPSASAVTSVPAPDASRTCGSRCRIIPTCGGVTDR